MRVELVKINLEGLGEQTKVELLRIKIAPPEAAPVSLTFSTSVHSSFNEQNFL
jgi:hypothetical protein